MTDQEWTSTRDGVRLAVGRWHPAADRGTAVVVVHGFGATKESPTVAMVAETLAADGHQVLSYTARGHGQSEGSCTLGDLEHLDVEAATELARQSADRVVLVGASMGAIAVLRHASHRAPDGVVTVSSPADWSLPRTLQSAGAAVLTQTRAGRWIARRALRVRLSDRWTDSAPPVDLARKLDVPLAVIHGHKDAFIKSDEAHKLYEASPDPRRIELVDRMGHAYAIESVPVIRDCVRWALSTALLAASNPSPATLAAS
jgi:alpha-beta hydrolase superfamily lysophospholipase